MKSWFVNFFLHGGNCNITRQKLQQKKENLDFCKYLRRKHLGGGVCPPRNPLIIKELQLNIKISKEILKNAFNGVKPLEQLRNTFPKEARSALKEFHTKNDKDKISQKILVFLKTHITTRSLKPISGDSIDAILSRAERSLKLNNLGDALKELKSLPEDAKKFIHNWMIEAQITYKTKAELDKIFVRITEMRETND